MSALLSDKGVDTIRFRWRTDNDTFRAFGRRSGGTYGAYHGERFTQTPLGRIGAFPDGLVYLEGRAAAIAAGYPDNHDLLPVDDLLLAEQVARQLVTNNGAQVGNEPARLGRIDLAAELRFSDHRQGSAFLHSLASLDVPWCKSRADGRKGDNIETVSFHSTSGKTILLRTYDKGVESGTATVGHRLRMERQKRYRKTKEPTVAEFQTYDVRSIFLGREFAQLTQLPSATICDVPQAMEVLWNKAKTWRQFERMAAFITAGSYIDYPRTQYYARAAELRSMGLSIDPSQFLPVQVPVGQYMRTLAGAWGAAA